MKRVPLILISFLIGSLAFGQCGKFADSPQGDEGLKNHTLYRDLVKTKEFDQAYPLWKKAYDIAPAADGKRTTHYTDGIKIYKHLLSNEEDEAKRTEYAAAILRLHDERIECYGKEGYVLGRKVSDMLYHTGSHDADIYETGKKSIELQESKTEYLVLYPYATAVVNLYKEGNISAEEAREAYKKLNKIADDNITDPEKEKYKEKYSDAKEQVAQLFDEIAQGANGQPALFDCAYFVEQERSTYDAAPSDIKNVEEILGRLRGNGCDESNTFYNDLFSKLKAHRASVILEEKERKREEAIANRTEYDWGKVESYNKNFEKAMEHFQNALDAPSISTEDKADAAYRMAVYYYGTKGQKSKARTLARKAISFRGNWAAPYVLIGEMYASSGKDCGKGTGFNSQRVVWAAIDKWKKAISLEPGSESAARAQRNIDKYTQYMPTQEDCFMQSLKKGQPYKVPCWINETTTIRYVK